MVLKRVMKFFANDDLEANEYDSHEADWPESIMLREELWHSIAPEGEFLCKKCIEERLGRPLTGWDLKDCPLNHETWPDLMYDVLKHTSYGESYRRMFVDRLFDPMGILLALVRGYGSPSDMGMDNDDPLAADNELDEARRKSNLSMVRGRFGIDDQANDNDQDTDVKESA